MPLPRWLARFNLLVTNRILGSLARRAPWMGIIIHKGRKSGRQYQTPVMVFRRGHRLTIALTYGTDTQWVQNVLAARGCTLLSQNHKTRLSHPHLFRDERRGRVPLMVRWALGILNVSDFIELTVEQKIASQ